MKLHDELLDVLGEIDHDLLPDLTEKTSRPKKQSRMIRWTAAAAAVCLLAGGGFLLSRRTAPPVTPIPATVYASDIVPRYLLTGREEHLLTSDQLITVAPVTGISLQPQIFTAESAADIVLPDNLVFADNERRVWRLFTNESAADDLLERNLRTDLLFANYIRDYGCVLWSIDWETDPAEAAYLGIAPLADREEAVRRLLEGQAVTTVPASELPEEGITADRIDRRTLVYLIPKNDRLIKIYECFFVRLSDSADGESRWGLYYVPVTDEEQTEHLISQTKD